MGATYTRQSSYTDGDTITAAHTNDEFNQLLAAFAASTGHTHDGTTAEGGPVTKLLGNTLTFGAATAGTDITITFDGESNDGVLKWMEDEDYFEFSDDILIATTEKLQFRDTAIYIHSSADGQLDLIADTEIQIAATTVDINGNVDISGTLTIGGAGISEAELEILDGATVTTTEINIMDGDTSASATTVVDADRVVFNDAGTMKQVAVTDLAAYFDDEITAMPNLVTTAATTVGVLNSGSITSGFGTIDTGSSTITTTGLISGGSLDIDDVLINGTTIGHTDDTDLITLSNGVVTVAGELDAVSLDISGDADIDGTLEADAITIAGVTLAETISDTVGAMVSSNTETNITVSYDDADNTLDFVIGTLNQDTTGNAATATALETARTIHGVSFDGSANIDLSEVISDTVGAMVSSNTETGIAVAYQDADNTIDFTLGTAQTTIESVKNTSLVVGRDDDNLIKFSTDNQIIFEVSGGDNVIFKASGEIEASSLDISGDADIDGTLEADAMTLNGTAITTVATLSTGISNGNLAVFTSGAADNDFLRIDGTSIEGRSAAEVLSDIGGTTATDAANEATALAIALG
jgi:cytoskeletal protein CcmA (bactofilin family)